MFNLADFFWLTVLSVFCVYLWKAHGMKERALAASKHYCHQMDVNLLDDSVVLKGFWFKRDANGSLRMWRSYLFEFTATGFDRHNGKIVLLGNKVESIQLEPYREH